MGTWGPKVLQNDACCDYMWGIYHTMLRCSANALHDIAKNLMLNPESPGYNDDSYMLLGVAMVDASINGVEDSLLISDHYVGVNVDVEFFKYLKYTPMFDLVPTAKETIQYLMNKGVSNWSERSKESRMQLYQTYMHRLEEVK